MDSGECLSLPNRSLSPAGRLLTINQCSNLRSTGAVGMHRNASECMASAGSLCNAPLSPNWLFPRLITQSIDRSERCPVDRRSSRELCMHGMHCIRMNLCGTVRDAHTPSNAHSYLPHNFCIIFNFACRSIALSSPHCLHTSHPLIQKDF